jgi:hypothetical protein
VKRTVAAVALTCFAWAPVFAERPPNRFEVSFGAYVPSLDTRIRLDGSGGQVGVELDFEENFNLESSKVVPVMMADLWISKKHGLGLVGFDLSRSSSGVSTIAFRFGDEFFPADLPLDVSFNTKVLALTYSYKFFNNAKRSFGFNVGFNINALEAAIATEEGAGISESGETTAPLPVIGVNGHVLLGKKWKFYGTAGVFALSFDEYEGALTSLSGGFIHQTFKHVGFGVGLYSFNVRIDSENEDFLGKVRYGYNGPVAYLNLRF